MLKKLKLVGFFPVFIAYNLALLVAFSYLPYRFYVHRLQKLVGGPTEYYHDEVVDQITSKRLGKIRTEKAERNSLYLNFLQKKQNGKVRIGCLGDSFTYGDEVGRNQDFPFLLQKKFEEAGVDNVEVINFGNSWHGFHQTFITWKYIARAYGLDKVILGPRTFFQERDRTFNHAGERAPNYIHSRYVLADGGLKLIDVEGDTPAKTFESYNSFFPDLNVLLYDWNPPAFIRAFIPQGQELKNPFYYYPGMISDEVKQIYRLLINEIVDSGATVYIGVKKNVETAWLKGIGEYLNHPNIYDTAVYLPSSFPYRMPQFHANVLGNEVLAQQYFDFLSGSNESNLTLIKLKSALDDKFDSKSEVKGDLSIFDTINFSDDLKLVTGHLTTIASSSTNSIPIPQNGKSLKGIKRLLAIVPKGRPQKSVLDSLIILSERVIPEGTPLILRSDSGKETVVGNVSATAGGIFQLIEIDGADVRLWRSPRLKIPNLHWEDSRKFKFLIDGTQIFEGTFVAGSQDFIVEESGRPLLMISSNDQQANIKPVELLKSGKFYLNLSNASKNFRIPIADFSVESCKVPFRSDKYDKRCSPLDP